MEWTNDQNNVLDQVLGNNKWLTISGSAGCGKTTIIKHITTQLEPETFALLGPTHSSARNYDTGKTIHDFFNILPVEPESPVVQFKMKESQIKSKAIKTIFIDECTMVKNSTLKDVMKICKQRKIRLIGVGDKYQLPAVADDNKFNDFFKPSIFKQPTMSEIVRQSADNPVIKLSNLYKQYKTVPDISNTDLAVTYKSKEAEFIFEFVSGIEAGNHDKIIAFSNNDVDFFNNLVHDVLYETPYCVGETVVLNENLYLSNEYGETEVYHNGLECVITASEPKEDVIIDYQNRQHKINCFELAIKDEVGREILIKVADAKGKALLKEKRDEYENFCLYYQKNKMRVKEAELVTLFGKSGLRGYVSVSYGYATTIHKSQGKTYDNSFVFTGGALYYMAKKDIELHNRLLYTAFTRCRHLNHTLQFKAR